MRKITILLSTLVLAAMLLVACGGEESSTGAPSTSIATMEEPTSAATSTEAAPAGTGTVSPTEGTPGVPVTGEENPSRISNQLDYNVWNQDGEQIGEVNDMVLDLDDARVSYVIVGTGGFLELGERDILVPWDSLQLQTEGGDMTGGEQNAFILQTDQDVFANAPDVDVNTILPALGEPAADWDLEIR
ncbi:MAG TPA: PRC-barrel domain-containing protein, partial [Anaerolineales bacterium]|nr:PRC-barrel domain-containing protein [Anaerolineales bacterium]